MSMEQQIKQFNSEEQNKKNAVLKSINMDYVDIISKSAPEYKERVDSILEEMTLIIGRTMTQESEERLDYLEKQYRDIEKLIQANKKAKIELKDSSSLN